MKKKSQSAIEFIILIGAMLFFFVSLLVVFQGQIGEKSREKRGLEVQEVALLVQNELNVAAEATDGYQRVFHVPEKILNIDYNITLVSGSVFIETTDGKNALALPVQDVTGQIAKGDNLIRKEEGVVYLNFEIP